MARSLDTLQSLAFSVMGALLTGSLFLAVAVGPVPGI
jgi:hypothetical protein